jgi:hypothetical protein
MCNLWDEWDKYGQGHVYVTSMSMSPNPEDNGFGMKVLMAYEA